LNAWLLGEIKFFPEKLGQHLQPVAEQHSGLVHLAAAVVGATRSPPGTVTMGSIFVAHDQEEARAQAEEQGYSGPLARDPDVLDTWYSSALWPFSTLDWTPQWPHRDEHCPRPVFAVYGAGHRFSTSSSSGSRGW
jgi:hypothetical protein